MGSRGADRLPIRRLHVLAPQCLREQIGGAGPRLIVGARCLLPRCVDFLEVGGDLKNHPPGRLRRLLPGRDARLDRLDTIGDRRARYSTRQRVLALSLTGFP